MKKIIFTLVALAFAGTTMAQKNAKTNTANMHLKNEKDSVSYSLGMLVGKNLKSQGFEGIDLDIFQKAIKDMFENKTPECTEMQAQTTVQGYAMEQQKVKAEKNLKEGEAFLEKNKTKPGVKVTPSGLQYEVIKEGDPTGQKPNINSQVTANYHGTLINGTVFDSSVDRGQPFKTSVGQVIKAWQEALQMMTPGTKLRIYTPASLAYGERGAGQMIGPNQVLIFDMELISIDKL